MHSMMPHLFQQFECKCEEEEEKSELILLHLFEIFSMCEENKSVDQSDFLSLIIFVDLI